MTLRLDRKSLLAQADGAMTLAEVEASLKDSGLTLGVLGATDSAQSVAAWLAAGAAGARETWLDPADHLVAGLVARLHDGRSIEIRPAPRRAVGPDLIALVVGMGERYAKVESAWLRVHPKGVKRPDLGRLAIDLNPPLDALESRLLEAIARRLSNR
jgi:alkyldihydroxyacetonephosphate synthase